MTVRVGVVGHVEWVQFAVVERVPSPGEIVHARETFSEPAGGGGVAAVQMAKLAGSALFLTALGHDDVAAAVQRVLRERFGVEVHAASRPSPQRRCFTYLDDAGERTITVLGERIVPLRADPLPWEALAELDGIYLTGGDGGAVRAARAARVLVRSASDPGEAYEPGMLDPPPRWVISTRGGLGGSWTGETSGEWQATALPGPPVDAYGCGDSFAAAIAYGLAAGMALPEAIELGARCGAACLTGRGPYGAQLSLG